jgi:hypothetical protein
VIVDEVYVEFKVYVQFVIVVNSLLRGSRYIVELNNVKSINCIPEFGPIYRTVLIGGVGGLVFGGQLIRLDLQLNRVTIGSMVRLLNYMTRSEQYRFDIFIKI